MPRVSIIIPCYNAAAWLPAAIESALAQTHRDIEVILVDDGSQDDSLAVARRYESQGVRVISQPNRGASAARNHGLRLAQGDYIQFLDADDLIAPDKIARQLDALAVAPDCIAAGPWGRFETDIAHARFVPEENWCNSEPVDWLTLNFAGRGMMQPGAWLTPRALIERAGPWDERLTLNDDGEYFCRVLLASRGIKFCADARSYYRSNLSGSLSRGRSEAAWRSAFLSHELCVAHLLAHEDSARTRRAGADLFQRLAFAMYPDCPDIVTRCEAEVARLGGSAEVPGGGRVFQVLTRVFGWKAARRWQDGWRQRARNVMPSL